jgi:hypothetical protein
VIGRSKKGPGAAPRADALERSENERTPLVRRRAGPPFGHPCGQRAT